MTSLPPPSNRRVSRDSLPGAAPPARASGRGDAGRRSSLPPEPSSRRPSLPAEPSSRRSALPPEPSMRRSGAPAEAGNRMAAGTEAGRRRGSRVPPQPSRLAGSWLARFRLATGIIVVLTASVLVAWGLRRYLQSSPRFAIRTVQVAGNVRRTAHQLAQRAGAEVGKNIFAVDLQIAKQTVETDEWVEHATVSRDLPSTIRIEVTEREPRALALLGGRLFLVDGKGSPFKALKSGDPSDLPVVTGLDPEQVTRDREGATQRMRRVVDLLGDLERVGIARRYPVQEVHLEPDDSAVVTIGSDAILLQLGRPPYRAKVEKADRILLEVARRKAKPDVIFLDDDAHPERVVVRMR
jgi:cell division protein FtsQ